MPRTRRPQAWVATVAPEEATGLLKEAYDWQAQRLGGPTEFTQLGSLHPELVYERLRLYKVVDSLRSGLTDRERHIVAYLTSLLNETPHCASGARQKLHLDETADELVEHLAVNAFAPATGDERLDAIVEYTATLTRSPGSVTQDHIKRLRSAGLSDGDIIALNNLSAYFCYTNRVATGLGLRTEIPEEHAVGAAPR